METRVTPAIRCLQKYLRVDGIFILRQIAQHAVNRLQHDNLHIEDLLQDVVFTTDLIAELWCGHYRIEKRREWVQ